jgi:hypothetical protein
MNFGPRGVDQSQNARMVVADDAIKKTIVSKQTKIAELVPINVIISS